MFKLSRSDLAHDLVLPTTLFAALGAMNWAVRGCRGFGGGAGCIFAGVLWGAAWWYCARDPARQQSRRYASGWIILALTFGIGISGERGWRQWSHFFSGQLATSWARQEFEPISSFYGFLWLFIAGVPWAGLGACFLAWCGARRETRVWHWLLRIAFGIGAGTLARFLFDTYPEYFLPLYSTLETRYANARPNGRDADLLRIINDCGLAITHLGYYLGFLLFEVVLRDWKNVVLILTVGLVNGAGWAALQNWEWAPGYWQNAKFAWWRCWESTGGISMGIAYGLAYFVVNRRMSEEERALVASRRALAGPNFEWLLVYCGLAAILSVYAAGLLGWRGSIGMGELGLEPEVVQFLRDHLDAWGNVYFAIIMLFGAAYYFRNRGTAVDELPPKRWWLAIVTNVEFGAVCVVVALVAPLFAAADLQDFFLDQMHRVLGTEIERTQRPRGLMQFRIVYVAVVTLFGIAWYLVRRKTFDAERRTGTPSDGDSNLERLAVALGVLAGLGTSLMNGVNGWFRTYTGESRSLELWHILGPVYLLCLLALMAWILLRPQPRNAGGDPHPRAYGLLWLVLIVQNAIAQLVTGPLTQWNEMAFSIYYVLLFIISAVIVFHIHFVKTHERDESSQLSGKR